MKHDFVDHLILGSQLFLCQNFKGVTFYCFLTYFFSTKKVLVSSIVPSQVIHLFSLETVRSSFWFWYSLYLSFYDSLVFSILSSGVFHIFSHYLMKYFLSIVLWYSFLEFWLDVGWTFSLCPISLCFSFMFLIFFTFHVAFFFILGDKEKSRSGSRQEIKIKIKVLNTS